MESTGIYLLFSLFTMTQRGEKNSEQSGLLSYSPCNVYLCQEYVDRVTRLNGFYSNWSKKITSVHRSKVASANFARVVDRVVFWFYELESGL